MMRSRMLILHFILPHFARALLPDDPQAIYYVPNEVTKPYPAFLGLKTANSERQDLSIKLLRVIDRTLYVGARNNIYTVDLDGRHSKGIFLKKKLEWASSEDDMESCRIKGQEKKQCHNYIKVLLKKNDDTLFVCGTKGFNPTCRNYKMDTLEQDGGDIKGQGRCPYHPDAENFALFSDGNLYTGTIADMQGIDSVIYRSLGDSPYLRTAKQNSKWLKEPNFVHSLEYGDYIYFFFREIAVEFQGMQKEIVPRVGRVCKNDNGGTMAFLDKHWTSFLKARLECSISGDSNFFFNILQSVTDVIEIDGIEFVLAIFTTPKNSIPGSAVCAFSMKDIEKVFDGKFKGQKNAHSVWTAVPDNNVPTPRPGACAGSGPLEEYASSSDLPAETLKFINEHSLMHEAVLPHTGKPWFHQTTIREHLIKIIADTTAGPTKNSAVVFVGSETGKIMKFLAITSENDFLDGSLYLEQLNVYNPEKCDYDGNSDRRIVDMKLDKTHGALFVAFPQCIIKVPLGRCDHYGTCKKSCISARDPYCGWVDATCVQWINAQITGAEGEFLQDIKYGNTEGMEDC